MISLAIEHLDVDIGIDFIITAMITLVVSLAQKYLLGVSNNLLTYGSTIMACTGMWIAGNNNGMKRLETYISEALDDEVTLNDEQMEAMLSEINNEQKEALDLFSSHMDMSIYGFYLIIAGSLAFIVILILKYRHEIINFLLTFEK